MLPFATLAEVQCRMEIPDDFDMTEWELVHVRHGIPKSTLPEGPRISADRFPTHYEVFRKLDLLWYWRLWSATHDLVATSAQGYERKEDCLAFIALVKSTANDPIWDMSK